MTGQLYQNQQVAMMDGVRALRWQPALALGMFLLATTGRVATPHQLLAVWATRQIDLARPEAAVVLYGAPDKDQLGNDMAAGDVNGDGVADLILGAHFGSPAGRNNAGRTYVVFGASTWPPVRDLALHGPGIWSFVGVGLEPRLGSAVAAGDVGGNAIWDLLIGSLLADPADPRNPGRTLANAGAVAVMFGRTDAGGQHDFVTRPADSLVAGESGQSADQLGTALASCDFNGDGHSDLIMAAALRESQTGAVYIVYGPIAAEVRYLGDRPADLTILGPGKRSTFGAALACGDVSGDGISDLAITSSYATPGEVMDTGATHVFFGQAQPELRGIWNLAASPADATIEGEPGSLLGVALNLGVRSCRGQSVAIGDLTGDGWADLIIGAPNAAQRRGEVWLFAGPLSAGRYDRSAAAWVVSGDQPDGRMGWSLAVGALDSDAPPDLVVASPWASAAGRIAAGLAYGFRGPLVLAPGSVATPWPPELTILGPEPYAGNAGMSLTIADTSNDGRADLHLSFPDMAPLGRRSAGAAYRISGPVLPTLPSPSATASVTPPPTATPSATASTTPTSEPSWPTTSASPTEPAPPATLTPEPTASGGPSPTAGRPTGSPPTGGSVCLPLVLARA